MCRSISGGGNEHAFGRLKETLRPIQFFKSKTEVVQEAFDKYISTSLLLVVPLQNVQAQLQKLYQEESLISQDQCKQAQVVLLVTTRSSSKTERRSLAIPSKSYPSHGPSKIATSLPGRVTPPTTLHFKVNRASWSGLNSSSPSMKVPH